MKLKIWIFFFSAFMLSSCFKYEDIKVDDVQNYRFGFNEGLLNIKLDLPIENPNNYNIKIKDIFLTVFFKGVQLGEVNSVDDIKLIKKKKDLYEVNLNLKVQNLIMGMALVTMNKEKIMKELAIEGSVTAQRSFLKKKFKFTKEDSRAFFE